MATNVMIPLSLMESIIDLLGYWDVSKSDAAVQIEHYEVLRFLRLKKRRLELRGDYTMMIRAKDEDGRHDARIRYLQEKSWLLEDERGCPF